MQPSQARTELKLPRQVVRRSAAIEARYKPAEPDNPNPADLNAPADTPPAASEAKPTDPQPPTPQGDPRDTDPAYWKQRFQVTDGLLKRERTDRQREQGELHQRVNDLSEQVRTLKSAAPANSETPVVDIKRYFSPAQIETYGEEQCLTMAKAAEVAAETKAGELIEAAMKPLREQQARDTETAAERSKREFYDALAVEYPNYAAADVDPSWLAYLEADDENEVQRQGILDAHIRNRNVKAIGRMFKAWEKSIAPAPAAKPPVPPMSPSGSGAAPGDSASNAPAAPDGSEPVGYPTAAEIKDFYKRSSINKVGTAERSKFEARLALPKPR
jgi:hypothetical protein